MSNSTTEFAKAILLHPSDNILVCVAPIAEGDTVQIDEQPVVMSSAIGVGHKLARRDLAVGDKVYRYGAPIGSITQTVAQGAHVHMHNMKSDYLPSHTRTRQESYRSDV